MKELIRNILREDNRTEVVLNYFRKLWQKDIDSGNFPRIPYIDIKRKKLDSFYGDIKVEYFDFVGGKEKAFEYFEKSIENKVLTDKDLSKIIDFRNSGAMSPDTFTFKIYGVTSVDYKDGEVDEIEFVFDVLDGNFEIDGGTFVTWSELMSEEMDHLYNVVSGWIRELIEDYVDETARSYGFNIISYGSWT
jgi:hypothetical protein